MRKSRNPWTWKLWAKKCNNTPTTADRNSSEIWNLFGAIVKISMGNSLNLHPKPNFWWILPKKKCTKHTTTIWPGQYYNRANFCEIIFVSLYTNNNMTSLLCTLSHILPNFPCNDDFTIFLKMYGNLLMTIAYTNSYRNKIFCPNKIIWSAFWFEDMLIYIF